MSSVTCQLCGGDALIKLRDSQGTRYYCCKCALRLLRRLLDSGARYTHHIQNW